MASNTRSIAPESAAPKSSHGLSRQNTSLSQYRHEIKAIEAELHSISRSLSSLHGRPPKFNAMSAYWLLFGLNCVPIGLFWYSQSDAKYAQLKTKVRQNTAVSAESVDQGRWWTIITSTFTHYSPVHFGFNMVAMHSFCQYLSFVPFMHGGQILAIALGSGIVGSAGYVLHKKRQMAASRDAFTRTRAYQSAAVGASGAVMGLATVATCLFPTARAGFLFIPVTVPLWVTTIGYFLVDSYYLNSETSFIAHAGHLGGAIFGVGYYFAVLAKKSPVGILPSAMRLLRRR